MSTKRFKVIQLLIFLSVLLAAIIIFIFAGFSQKITKNISADKLDCLGSLMFEETVFVHPFNSTIKTDEEVRNENPSFVITDDLFLDEFHGVRVDKPIYKLSDGAFDVVNGKTYAVLSAIYENNYSDNNSVDFSAYRTRKALRVFDRNGNDCSETVYCCVDDLGNTDVYITKFHPYRYNQKDSEEFADFLLKLSKNPYEEKTASSLNLNGTYGVSQVVYTSPLNEKELNNQDYLNSLKFTFSNELFSCGEQEIINNALLRTKENAFEVQGKHAYAIMYYVGEKWNSFNSVDVTSFKEKTAYNIIDKNGKETGYTVYLLTNENAEEEIYISRFVKASSTPSHSEYFLKLQKDS